MRGSVIDTGAGAARQRIDEAVHPTPISTRCGGVTRAIGIAVSLRDGVSDRCGSNTDGSSVVRGFGTRVRLDLPTTHDD